MRVLRLHPDRRFRLHEEPEPVPSDGEVLVRVDAVGLCGSDRHWFVDGGIGDDRLDRPIVLGHECCGTVLTGAMAGRRVAMEPALPCRACEWCRAGTPNVCPRGRFAGHGPTDGALRELIAWPEWALYPLSENVTLVVGAMVEPLAVAVYTLELGRVVEGMTVGVIGCGPIGIMLAGLARRAGATTVVASDPLPHRRTAALVFGATHAVASTTVAVDVAAILEITRGRGLDVTFDVAGDASAVETAIAAARPAGRVVLAGIPSDDRTVFTASVARRKGLTLAVARRSTPDAFERAAALVEAGTFELERLCSMRVPLLEGSQAFEALARRDGIKVLIEPGQA